MKSHLGIPGDEMGERGIVRPEPTHPSSARPTSRLIAVGLILLAGIGLTYWRWPPPQKQGIHYPYICRNCSAIFDVSELQKPGNWRAAAGGGSDSVVYCLRCRTGWAYPVAQCPSCGTEYIMHLLPRESRCPVCYPEVADAAARAGLDLILHRTTTQPRIER